MEWGLWPDFGGTSLVGMTVTREHPMGSGEQPPPTPDTPTPANQILIPETLFSIAQPDDTASANGGGPVNREDHPGDSGPVGGW